MQTQMFTDKLRFTKENKGYWILVSMVALTLCIELLIRVPRVFIRSDESLSKEVSMRDFCSMSMTQMIHKKLSKKLVSSGLYPQVVSDNYKNMFFDEDDKVTSVFSQEKVCKVIVQTKNGIRSFDLKLDESGDKDFYFEIVKIHENELYEKES